MKNPADWVRSAILADYSNASPHPLGRDIPVSQVKNLSSRSE
jgi:hypothetical protein